MHLVSVLPLANGIHSRIQRRSGRKKQKLFWMQSKSAHMDTQIEETMSQLSGYEQKVRQNNV